MDPNHFLILLVVFAGYLGLAEFTSQFIVALLREGDRRLLAVNVVAALSVLWGWYLVFSSF